jgi:hypothetical protein
MLVAASEAAAAILGKAIGKANNFLTENVMHVLVCPDSLAVHERRT